MSVIPYIDSECDVNIRFGTDRFVNNWVSLSRHTKHTPFTCNDDINGKELDDEDDFLVEIFKLYKWRYAGTGRKKHFYSSQSAWLCAILLPVSPFVEILNWYKWHDARKHEFVLFCFQSHHLAWNRWCPLPPLNSASNSAAGRKKMQNLFLIWQYVAQYKTPKKTSKLAIKSFYLMYSNVWMVENLFLCICLRSQWSLISMHPKSCIGWTKIVYLIVFAMIINI